MKREVDQRKTRKALRKLRQAAESAEEEGAPGLTTWEKDFVDGVTIRLEKYGSAFRDPGKGRLEEALSNRQQQVTRAITAKTRKARAAAKLPPTAAKEEAAKPAPRSSFQRKSTLGAKPKTGGKPGGKLSNKSGAKSAWKPRIRDINDDSGHATPDATPQRPRLKIIPGGTAD